MLLGKKHSDAFEVLKVMYKMLLVCFLDTVYIHNKHMKQISVHK